MTVNFAPGLLHDADAKEASADCYFEKVDYRSMSQ